MKNTTKILTLIIFTLAFAFVASAQKVKWYTFSEAVKLNETQPRNIMVDVYTDWCGWCKVMDEKTFSIPEIANVLNKQFYAVKFNAETKDTIVFKGHSFINDGEGRRPPHQLAVALLQGQLSYPNIVFLDKTSTVLGALPGFKKPEEMKPILDYISKELYKQKVDLGKYIQENQ